jgi:hypothetical protein
VIITSAPDKKVLALVDGFERVRGLLRRPDGLVAFPGSHVGRFPEKPSKKLLLFIIMQKLLSKNYYHKKY